MSITSNTESKGTKKTLMAFTFFFRDIYTLERAIEIFAAESIGYQKIYVWDAGCATGQEPYTLAMLIAEKMGPFAFRNLCIDATDIDSSDLFQKTIHCGVYPIDQVKRIPDLFREKYFEFNTQLNQYKICSKLTQSIKFHKHNLLDLRPIRSQYSMIICKNVLLHFDSYQRISVLQMYHQVLRTNGLLVMEKTQKIPDQISHLFTQVCSDAHIFRKNDNDSDIQFLAHN